MDAAVHQGEAVGPAVMRPLSHIPASCCHRFADLRDEPTEAISAAIRRVVSGTRVTDFLFLPSAASAYPIDYAVSLRE